MDEGEIPEPRAHEHSERHALRAGSVGSGSREGGGEGRRERGRRVLRAGIALLLGLVASLLLHDPAPDPDRGKQLYLRGVDREGRALAGRLADLGAELTGSAAACARCHGHAGKGSAEGGFTAPEITAARLFRDQPHRPAYDDAAVVAALTQGRSSRGDALAVAMPRYALTRRDRRDLVAWLRVLGERLDPGVSDQTIRVGALRPDPASRAVLEAYFREIGAQGGIHGRRLELVAADSEQALLDAPVFALVGGDLPADRKPFEEEGIPAIAPFVESTDEEPPLVFRLYPPQAWVARVASQEILRDRPGCALAVVSAGDPLGESWVRGARIEAQRRGASPPAVHRASAFDPAAAMKALRAADVCAVLFAGPPDELATLRDAIAAAGLEAKLHAPALAALRGDRRRLTGIVFWSPTLLDDQPQPGTEEYAAFLRRHGLDRQRHPAQHHAWAAARLLVEGLRRAGAQPTRAALVEALESLRGFPTGVTPPISFGPYRRTGLMGAFRAHVDPATGALLPAGAWSELAPF